MSDLRFDPISGQWVSIATNRNDRPIEFVPIDKVVKRLICPFCEGNEEETPEAWEHYWADGSSSDSNLNQPDKPWVARVVPNKYPSITQQSSVAEQSFDTESNGVVSKGCYQSIANAGVQDLIIPSPRHIISMSELTDLETTTAFRAYQNSLIRLRENPSIRHAMLFTNCRSAAGASLEHLHSQLIGVPMLSDYLSRRVSRNAAHYQEFGTSIIQSLCKWECEQGDRMIEQTDHFTVFCSYASRFPFQIWIVPKRNKTCFLHCESHVRDELAMVSRKMVRLLETVVDQLAYNVLFHIPPFDDTIVRDQQHWYVELFPRMTNPAGFELGTDVWVNPVAPESAARRLRSALASLDS